MTDITEEEVRRATEIIIAKGYKPEDYLMVQDDFPIRIARMIVSEIRHQRKMQEGREKLRKIQSSFFYRLFGNVFWVGPSIEKW